MAMTYRFTLAVGHSVGRRAIGFLEEELGKGERSELDAKRSFAALSGSRDRDIRKKFDHWLAGGPPIDRWFHGWPNDSECRECFCFKWDERNGHHRFYGFLYHPQPRTNPAFQICVLAYHDHKTKRETDRRLLIRSMNLRSNSSVQMAIAFVFSDQYPKKRGQVQ